MYGQHCNPIPTPHDSESIFNCPHPPLHSQPHTYQIHINAYNLCALDTWKPIWKINNNKWYTSSSQNQGIYIYKYIYYTTLKSDTHTLTSNEMSSTETSCSAGNWWTNTHRRRRKRSSTIPKTVLFATATVRMMVLMLFVGSVSAAVASGHHRHVDDATMPEAVVKESIRIRQEGVVVNDSNSSSSRRNVVDTWPEMSLIIAASDDPFAKDGKRSSGSGNVTLVLK